MGFLDEMRDKATDAVDEHGEQIGTGLDKGADVLDEKTGGEHADRIDTGAAKAKDALDGLDGADDDIR